MKKFARYYSGFLVLPLIIGLIEIVLSVTGISPSSSPTSSPMVYIAKICGFGILTIPLVLAVIVLGSETHRWERYALRGNQLVSVVSAFAFAWAILNPKEQAAIYGMWMAGPVLNWVALAKEERGKTFVAMGFAIFSLVFIGIGLSINPDARERMEIFNFVLGGIVLQALIAALMLVLGVLSWVYIRKLGLGAMQKDGPISEAILKGNLAARSELEKDVISRHS